MDFDPSRHPVGFRGCECRCEDLGFQFSYFSMVSSRSWSIPLKTLLTTAWSYGILKTSKGICTVSSLCMMCLHLLCQKKFTDLFQLADKVFVDVSRSEEFVKVTRCSMSKFKQADGKLLVVIHNIDTNGKISIFRDMWKEEEGSGVFNINGKAEETPYDEKLYILHADENAVAYYACNPATYNTRRLFRVAISLDKTKMGTPQAQKSVDTAFSKLKEMEAVIGALTNMPTKDCPAEFPEVPVPAELTELTKQP